MHEHNLLQFFATQCNANELWTDWRIACVNNWSICLPRVASCEMTRHGHFHRFTITDEYLEDGSQSRRRGGENGISPVVVVRLILLISAAMSIAYILGTLLTVLYVVKFRFCMVVVGPFVRVHILSNGCRILQISTTKTDLMQPSK